MSVESESLTNEELIKLAKFCGREPFSIGHSLWVSKQEGRVSVSWHPEADANQRDEVVEGLRLGGWFVHLSFFPGGPSEVAVTLHNAGTGKTIEGLEPTPGLAVCRAAFQAMP